MNLEKMQNGTEKEKGDALFFYNRTKRGQIAAFLLSPSDPSFPPMCEAFR